MEKVRIEENTVQETLLLPVWGRAQCTMNYPELSMDKDAVDIVDKVDYDFSKIKFPNDSQLMYGIRHRMLVERAKDFVNKHPEATIVNLGCGLDTSFSLVDNGTCRWVNLDLPDVIDMRKRLFEPKDREQDLAHDAFQMSWMDKVVSEPGEPVYVISGGVFYYFQEEDIRRLLTTLAYKFPGGGAFFDCENKMGVKQSNKMVVRSGNTGSPMYFYVNNAERTFRSWCDDFSEINEMDYTPPYISNMKGISSRSKLMLKLMNMMGIAKFVEIRFKDREPSDRM